MKQHVTIEQLHDWIHERLDEATCSAVEAHLSSCVSCMGLATFYRSLGEAARRLDPAGDHPPADELVAFVMNPEAVAPDRRAGLEGHVASCASCADEVERTRRAERALAEEKESGSVRPRLRRGVRPGWLAVAALVAGVALLYPAYLGLFRLPEVQRDRNTAVEQGRELADRLHALSEPPAAARAWDGPVALNVLHPSLRSGDVPPTVSVSPREPFVLLAFELLVPRSVPEDDRLRFEIINEKRGSVWVTTAPAVEIRDAVRRSELATLAVPSQVLRTGVYTLSVSITESSQPALAAFAFEIDMVPGQAD